MRGQALRIVSLLVFLGLVSVGRGADVERGFQLERRVHETTRLDWELIAGAGAKLPSRYDSRQQRYQLFVPATYKATKTWPLLIFLSPGDDPLGWRAWRKPCEDADWLFAAAYGAGNTCPVGQRIRAILDVLDDVRRNYRIDPDRTYLCGYSTASAAAGQIAFALPEHFGGVVLLSGNAKLPQMEYLRQRASERLSMALVAGSDDRARPQLEKYLSPLLKDLGIRQKLWVVPDLGRELPPAWVLGQVQRWLEEDLKRRQTDRRERIGFTEETPSRRVLASRALEQARKQMADPDRLHLAVAQLRYLVARWGRTEAGEKANDLLAEVRTDPRRSRILAAQARASESVFLSARARALARIDKLEEARRAWQEAARLTDGDERKKALAEAKRLGGLLARKPYLGAIFAGDTTTIKAVSPGGPAHRAGLRAGDQVVQMDKVKVASLADVRQQLQMIKPGDKLRLRLHRDEEEISLVVKVGSPPIKDE